MEGRLSIRAASRADTGFLADCNAAMARETEAKALPRERLEAGVAGVFDEPRRGFYRIAERDGEAVGSLLVTFEWSDWRNADFWWIQSVYVVPAARRTGIFRALYADVEAAAREAGAAGLRLYVERDNTSAQAVYDALGMHECAYRMYERNFTS
ncbi:MAG TPA: GNAT family N-acetyltransferase [Rhodanobacteraceae bacterium]|nr:GNAT family N-acetyltransferase [Rhodanobacteraceae bacterium]